VLEVLLDEHHDGVRSLLEQRFTFDPMPDSMKIWLARFIQDEDHRRAWQFFKTHTTRESLHELVRELLSLLKSGELRHAFSLIAFIRNDRLQEVTRTFLDWHDSGELEKFFQAISTITP